MTQESNSKEIELYEDGPMAMIALLRYVYDLPYKTTGNAAWPARLESYAEVYMVAAKYRIRDLQSIVSDDMLWLADNEDTFGVISYVSDFVPTLHKIVSLVPSGDHVRNLLVKICAVNIKLLRKEPEFLSLLREHGDLGADIIANEDLERGLLGSWMCSISCNTGAEPMCPKCNALFKIECAWESRYRERWYCIECDGSILPKCATCDKEVMWIQRGII